MNSKAIGITVAFTALTVALNLVRIPVPFLPNYSYQIGDIVLVLVFMLFGSKPVISAAFLTMVVSMTILIAPGAYSAHRMLSCLSCNVIRTICFSKLAEIENN